MKKGIQQAIDVAKATMKGDLRDVMLDIQKNPKMTAKPWSKMTEEEQRAVVNMIENRCGVAVDRAIDVIASEGRKFVKVQLKSVTIKDGIKGSFECSKSQELRHDLVDAQGDMVLVVLLKSEEYKGERAKVKYDKNEPELPMEEDDDDEEDTDETKHDPKTGEVLEDEGEDDDADDSEDDDSEESDSDDEDDEDDE